MSADTFDILMLLARPAAGKSEIIDYLKHTPLPERKRRFHIGDFVELDDFPMLWAWFEEDDLLSQMGHPRLHTDQRGYFTHDYFWDLLTRRLCLNYEKLLRDDPDFHTEKTVILEFARGTQHGGWASAFAHLSPKVLARAAVLYVNVSYAESLRKNRCRYNPDRPDSILEHGLPDEKMECLYQESDWEQVSAADPHYLPIQGYQVPYAVFENEDDVTTPRRAALGERLEQNLSALWRLYQTR
jgi:hypothetical protein